MAQAFLFTARDMTTTLNTRPETDILHLRRVLHSVCGCVTLNIRKPILCSNLEVGDFQVLVAHIQSVIARNPEPPKP